VRAALLVGAAVGALAGLAGCGGDNPVVTLPALDRQTFDCTVQPILDKKCAYLACHGNASQPLRIYSIGKLRLQDNPTLAQRSFTPLSEDERQANYQRAVSIGLSTGVGASSLFVQKPLNLSGGGLTHVGGQLFSGFTDPDYMTLLFWISGGASGSCDLGPIGGAPPPP
jgi:hypothetical protein